MKTSTLATHTYEDVHCTGKRLGKIARLVVYWGERKRARKNPISFTRFSCPAGAKFENCTLLLWRKIILLKSKPQRPKAVENWP